MSIPVQLNFEFEPDIYELAPLGVKSPTKSIRTMYEYVKKLRLEIEHATGKVAHFNWMWRFDPQFELTCGPLEQLVAQHRDIIEDALAQGDEFGLHFHPHRWDHQLDCWEFPYFDQGWIEAQLAKGLVDFEQLMGFKAEAVRLSDNILVTEAMLDLMEAHGVKRDITIQPEIRLTHTQWEGLPTDVSFSGFPDYPYRPERGNFRQFGQSQQRKLWMLLTSTDYVNKYIAGRQPEFKREYVALDLAFHPPTFSRILQKRLETLESPYLLIVANSYTIIDPHLQPYVKANLDFILNYPLLSLFEFVNSAELVKSLEVRNTTLCDSTYQQWLRQRVLEQGQQLEELERNYQKLEGYAQSLEESLDELNRLRDQFQSLEEYTRSLERELQCKPGVYP